MADLGGVPRVPEPPLVELDTRQADRRLRRRACVHATYAPVIIMYIAASGWPSSSIHHERADRALVL